MGIFLILVDGIFLILVYRNMKAGLDKDWLIWTLATIAVLVGVLYLLCRCLQTKKLMWRTWINLLNQTIDRINSQEAVAALPEGELNLIDVFLARCDKMAK